MKIMKIFYITGLLLSLFTGVWHFFIPYMYKWHSYIPEAPRNIIVSIDWINYFFSLLLTGISLILLFMTKQIFSRNREVLVFYSFLVFTWFNRIIITVVHPWPYSFIFILQLTAFIIIFLIMLVPLVYFMRKMREQ
jgi:hypothetical protein